MTGWKKMKSVALSVIIFTVSDAIWRNENTLLLIVSYNTEQASSRLSCLPARAVYQCLKCAVCRVPSLDGCPW